MAFIFSAALCRPQAPPPYTITTAVGTCVASGATPPCSTGFAGDGGSATSAQLAGPAALVFDSSGNLYIADQFNQRIRKVSGTSISTVVGNGTAGYTGDKGSATSAEISGPSGLGFDSSGNLYIADAGNFVVREVAGGNISTVAGVNSAPGFSPLPVLATSASLLNPTGVAVDSGGNIYIADPNNNVVSVVCNNQTPAPCATVATGMITTFAGVQAFGAGFSGNGGPSVAAQLNNPVSLTFDAGGNLYIADSGNNMIRKVTPAGIISTVAGNGSPGGYSGDGGQAIDAELNTPKAVAVDANGYIYIADYINSVIRAVSPDGTIATIAGEGSFGYSGDGGPATSAQLYFPNGVAVNGGLVYIADSQNNLVRVLTPAPQVPAVNTGGVVNSGNYSAQGVAPGSIVSIFGTNLAAGTASAGTIPLSTTLSDVTSVTFNGVTAPLYFVSSQQINAQLPWNVAGSSVNVVVTRSTGTSAGQAVTIVPAAPGIFTTNNNGLGQAFAYDNTTGAIAAPAGTHIGSFAVAPLSLSSGHALIIACTGLGSVTPSIDNGAAASDGTLRNTVLAPTVLIGGVQAQFVYSVLSPQFVSEYQIGVVPAPGTPTGDAVSVQIQMNGVTTSDQVTIAIAN